MINLNSQTYSLETVTFDEEGKDSQANDTSIPSVEYQSDEEVVREETLKTYTVHQNEETYVFDMNFRVGSEQEFHQLMMYVKKDEDIPIKIHLSYGQSYITHPAVIKYLVEAHNYTRDMLRRYLEDRVKKGAQFVMKRG